MTPVYEYCESRSRFLFYLKADLGNVAQFHCWLKEIKGLNPKARHVLYVFRIGNQEGCSENGEPVKAAHKQLAILSREGASGLGLVAVRYYGGKKLGAANLEHVFLAGFKMAVDIGKELADGRRQWDKEDR